MYIKKAIFRLFFFIKHVWQNYQQTAKEEKFRNFKFSQSMQYLTKNYTYIIYSSEMFINNFNYYVWILHQSLVFSRLIEK